jgi:hypothetical protein
LKLDDVSQDAESVDRVLVVITVNVGGVEAVRSLWQLSYGPERVQSVDRIDERVAVDVALKLVASG